MAVQDTIADGSDRQLRDLIDRAAVGVFAHVDGRIASANRAMARILGYADAKELIGLDVFADVIAPHDRARVRDYARARAAGEDVPFRFEVDVLNANADPVTVLVSVRLGRESGRAVFRGVCLDVTAQRRARLRLERSERDLRTIVDNLPDMFIRTDLEGDIQLVSPSCERHLGYRVDEMVGRRISGFFRAKADTDRLKDRILANQGRIGDYEAAMVHKDGTEVWTSIKANVCLDDAGGVIGIEGTARNMTRHRDIEAALRRSEAELRESEARLRRFAELGSEAILLHEHGRIVDANEAAERMFGYSRAEMLDRVRTYDLIAPDDRERLRSWVAENQEGAFEGAALHKDGRTFPASSHAIRTRYRGRDMRAVRITDMSERENLEQQMREAQKMEAIGRISGGVAHDFNNLLAVIVGNLEALGARLPAGDEAADMARRALAAADKGAGLTRRMLAFSRQQPLDPQNVDVRALIDGLRPLLRSVLPEPIAIEIDVDRPDLVCFADPSQLEQLLLNLILNARDAMPDGGLLSLSVRCLDGQDAVQITVRDSGIGMAPEVLARAVEPFFTTKDVGEGTGLGLSMVHGFATQSGGSVEIDSGIGAGTRVRVRLPAAEPDTAALLEPTESPAAAAPGSARILLVEDDDELRDLVRRQLESLGYRVLPSADADSALSEYGSRPQVDLLLTDIMLPGGKSGIDLANALREPRPDLPVLFMTGYSEDVVAGTDSLPAGAILQKPFRRARLGERLAEILLDREAG